MSKIRVDTLATQDDSFQIAVADLATLNQVIIAPQPTGADYELLQEFISDNAGRTIQIPAGTYTLTNGTVVVPSNTHIIGEPGTIIIQPNKGEFSAFATNPGTSNVTFTGLDIRGPWYANGVGAWVGVTNAVTVDGDTLSDLLENIGINCRGRWYQREILGYNNAQMNALTDTSFNIKVDSCKIAGFGQEAVFADRVTGFEVVGSTLVRCGRGGIRMYGVLRGFTDRNIVGDMSPGYDGNYPNWNVYGITCTRMQGTVAIPDPNLTISRRTEYVTVSNNKVYNCSTWKSLDNHGSNHIQFISNHCINSYIGLGLDQGGTDANRGIAPATNNIIKGNIFESNSAAYMRAGITAYGHDSTTQACDGLVVEGNIFVGYGGNDTDGGISLSNTRNGAIVGNIIKGPSRSGINLSAVCEEIVITGNTVEDPKSYITVVAGAVGSGYTAANTTVNVSGGGGTGLKVIPNIVSGQITTYSVVHPGTGYTSAPTITVVGDGTGATATATLNIGFGILSQTTTARAVIDNNNFSNKTQASMRGISRSAPAVGYGVRVGTGNTFIGTGITKLYPAVSTDESGTYARVPVAVARVAGTGTITTSNGIASVTKTGTGTYDVTLSVTPASINNVIPEVAPYGTLGTARAAMVSAGVFTVTTTNISGALTDLGFVLSVYNTLP